MIDYVYSHISVTPRKLGVFSGSLIKDQRMLTNNGFRLHQQPCFCFFQLSEFFIPETLTFSRYNFRPYYILLSHLQLIQLNAS